MPLKMRRCRAPRCCGLLLGNLIFTSPTNPERYRLWAEFLGTDPNPIKIRPTYVCEIHFEKKYLSILSGKPLNLLSGARARPTIHCYGPDTDISVGTKTPSPAAVTVIIARRIVCDGSCSNCKAILTTDSPNDIRIIGEQFQCSGDGLYPSKEFLKLVGSVATATEKVLEESAGIGGIEARVMTISNRDINHDWIIKGCSTHYYSVFETIVDTCCTL